MRARARRPLYLPPAGDSWVRARTLFTCLGARAARREFASFFSTTCMTRCQRRLPYPGAHGPAAGRITPRCWRHSGQLAGCVDARRCIERSANLHTPGPRFFAPLAVRWAAASAPWRRPLGSTAYRRCACARFFVNGDGFAPPSGAHAALALLADRRWLEGLQLARGPLSDLVFDWYRRGWLALETRS